MLKLNVFKDISFVMPSFTYQVVSKSLLHSLVNHHNFNNFICNFQSIRIIKFLRMFAMESKSVNIILIQWPTTLKHKEFIDGSGASF